MASQLTRLYPAPSEQLSLEGLYLAHELQDRGSIERPFVYSNFIASLDGRISLPHPGTSRRVVPPAIANPRDLRLFMELAAQADVLLTTARHLRAVAAGQQQSLIRVDRAENADLVEWRRGRGLQPQPVVAALSIALDIPAQGLVDNHPEPIVVFTVESAPQDRVRNLERAGIEVIRVGTGPRLTGAVLIEALARRGLPHVYSIAGPQVLHTLLESNVLDRLYLTLAHAFLGGDTFDTLTHGPRFEPARQFALSTLYLDPQAPGAGGQLLASYDRVGD